MNCLPVLNSSRPSGVSTAASSSVTSTLACVPRLASLISPADRSRCAGLAASSSLSARCFNCLVLDNKQVAAGVDADIVQLRRLLTQLLGDLHVALKTPFVRRIRFAERGARSRIGQRKHLRLLRPQEQRPVGGRVEKGAIVAADDDRHVARQRVQQTFKLADPGQIEVIGRLVQQQDIGFRHQRAGQHGKPLPAAAELLQRLLTQRLGDFELLQRHIDAPAFARLSLGGQRLRARPHGTACPSARAARPVPHSRWSAPRDRVISPSVASKQAGDAAQQRGFAAPVGGDETDPVAGD